ncbi:SCO2524 family protein [Actinoplanes sp. RD1]|uniref:SCO2524 family protein n=1 Tax=Actinoplanes sp. RD1 TaxID=3064538 RepID=UPI0027429C17|nr:SCO2524 family protein [Actinoplanes sp. RD1]
MQIQPRQQLLDIWRSTARLSFVDGEWLFGGRDGANSISDAEQLLCIMAPATEIPLFRLDNPNVAERDVLDALDALGTHVQVPQRLVRALAKYLERYTEEDGTPIFSGDTYFASGEPGAEIEPAQRRLDVVDSFSVSITLMLATIGFTRIFRQVVTRPDLLGEVSALEQAASKRLTAAMVGLLRSFAVNVFSSEDDFGQELIRMVNQDRRPTRQVVEELRNALREINARLRDDVTIGSGTAENGEFDLPDRLFECGWSWGIVKDAPQIDTSDVGVQRPGLAQNAPYMYFTAVALDAIQALSSERTRLLGLLDEAQLRLAQSLQLRFELTRSYWAAIAEFGQARWPLEDLPWRTVDGVEADYFTLLVSGMTMQNQIAVRAPATDLSRVAAVLEEVANRSRITRRSTEREPALDVHHPGLRFDLVGSEAAGGPPLAWTAADISPLLLRRTLTLAGLLPDGTAYSRLIDLADELWRHVDSRSLTGGLTDGLWDQPAGAYPQLDVKYTEVSWYYTKRVVDCLVTAARIINEPPLRSELLVAMAADLLIEAEHLYDRERLNNSTHSGDALATELNQIGIDLERARARRRERPGVAVAVAQDVLRRLDRLSAARQATRGTM